MSARGNVATLTASQLAYACDMCPRIAVRMTLPNGLRVVFVENHTVPVVWLNWVCLAGFEHDPASLAGLAALTPDLLREGTAQRGAEQITGEVEDLTGELIGGGDGVA